MVVKVPHVHRQAIIGQIQLNAAYLALLQSAKILVLRSLISDTSNVSIWLAGFEAFFVLFICKNKMEKSNTDFVNFYVLKGFFLSFIYFSGILV